MEAPSSNVASGSSVSSDPESSEKTTDIDAKDEKASMGVTSLIEKFEVEKSSDELVKQDNSRTSISPVRGSKSLEEMEKETCTPEKASKLSDATTEINAEAKETGIVKDQASLPASLDESNYATANVQESDAPGSSCELSASSATPSEDVIKKIESKIASHFKDNPENATEKSTSECGTKSEETSQPLASQAADVITGANVKDASVDDSETNKRELEYLCNEIKTFTKEAMLEQKNISESEYSDEMTSSNKKRCTIEGISSIPDKESEVSSANVCESKETSMANVSQDSSNASQPDKNIPEAVMEKLKNADKHSEDIASSSNQNGVKKEISLKIMEQLFISALDVDVPATENLLKDSRYIAVPDIKITDASDVEMDSDTETLKDENEPAAVAEVMEQRKRKRGSQSEKENDMEVAGSSTDDQQREVEEQSLEERKATSLKERKATFFISSSELQPERKNEATAPTVRPLPETSEQTRTCQEDYPCLASKSMHGSIIMSSIFVAAVGVALSNLAREGKAPAVCETIGLSTTIISGIVGILSLAYCCILSFLPCLTGNEPLTDIETLIPMYTPMLPTEYIHESQNLETERAFRRQNNMSSPRASAVASRRQNKQNKTETVRQEIRSAMKSLGNALNKLETDEKKERQPLLKDDKKDDSSD